MAPDRQRIQQYLKAFDFRTLFIEELGWDNLKLPGQPQGPTPPLPTTLAPTILRRRCPSLFIVNAREEATRKMNPFILL